MAIKNYYTAEYDLYSRLLEDVDSLNAYKNTLSDSVSQVSQMSSSFCDGLLELSGVSINQLNQQAKSFFDSIEAARVKIELRLPEIKATCDSLKDNLLDIQDFNQCLHEEYNYYNSIRDSENYTKEEKEKARSEYQASLELCEELDPVIKEEIGELRGFSDDLEDFSIKMLDYQIQFNEVANDPNLSDKEKLETAIDKYMELYEKKRRTLRSNGQDGLVSVLNALGYPYDISMDGPFNYESFKKLHAFINAPIVGDKTPINIINEYMTGKSWEDSGMASLAISIGNQYGMKVKSPIDSDYEAEFWANMLYQIDGRGTNNKYTPYFLMSTDYYKEHGGDIDDIYNMLFIDALIDENDPNYYYYTQLVGREYTTYRSKYKNLALFDSLKEEFVDEGYLRGVNDFVNEINQLNDEYGDDVLPFLEALDGRMDWTDNNSVIPKDAIKAYMNGASWEDSELSLYCAGKSEEDFLKDLMKATGKDYEVYKYTPEEWDKNLSQDQNSSYFTFKETNTGPNIFAGVDSEHPSAEQVKEILRSKGTDKKLGNYYDYTNQRNDQIDAETTDMYVLSKSVSRAKEMLAETEPTAKSILREQNKEQGKQMAEQYLGIVNAISGKDEYVHIMTQDEYVLAIQKDNPFLTRDEILKDYRDAWKEEYRNELINNNNYNPECARRMAELQNYDNKTVVKYDDLLPHESVMYFAREAASNGVTIVSGLVSGGVDLGRDLKHVVAPDVVPSAIQFAQDEIALQYNDPNSKYYDPTKGALYTTSRTIGHELPIEVLKAIPETRGAGELVSFLKNYGSNLQKAFDENGNNYLAAHANALGRVAVDKLANVANEAMADTNVIGKIATKALTGEFKSFGNNAVDVFTGVKTQEQAMASFKSDQAGIATDVFNNIMNVSVPGNQTITGDAFADAYLKEAAKKEGQQLIKSMFTGDFSGFSPEKQVEILSKTGASAFGKSIKEDRADSQIIKQ